MLTQETGCPASWQRIRSSVAVGARALENYAIMPGQRPAIAGVESAAAPDPSVHSGGGIAALAAKRGDCYGLRRSVVHHVLQVHHGIDLLHLTRRGTAHGRA